MITHAGTIATNVRDQQRAIEFYTETMGFQKLRDEPMGPEPDFPRWVEVAPAGAQTHLVLFTPLGQEDQIGTFSKAWLLCSDSQATVEELRQRGI